MHTLNRRDLLKLMAASTALPLVGFRVPPLTSPELAHGLFFDAEALATMRQLYAKDARFTVLREQLSSLDRAAERRFMTSEVRYIDQMFDLVRLGRVGEQMAFLYLMTGDIAAADLAADCVRTMMQFPRWDYFLEGGQHVIGVQRAPSSTIAVSLVSDWLGSRIADEERIEWLRVMGERGCEACYLSLYGIRYPREVVGWSFDETSTFFEHRPGNNTDLSRRPEITRTTNLRAVPAAALAVGTMATRAYFGPGETVRRWQEMAVYSLAAFEDIFQPDGSYHEGVGYANYTTTHLTQAITALQRHGAADLSRIVNWHGYVDYILNMSMPTTEDPYGIVNFGDNGNPRTGLRGSVARTAVPYWIARETGDARALWFGNHLGGDADMWSLLFLNPNRTEAQPKPGPRLWVSDLDWVVARTGFEADDLVVALRSGGPANHEHGDRNSLIVKCFGQQLVTDPYRPPYSFADPSWMMRTTAAHSAVLVDGQGHQHVNGVEGTNASQAHARLVHTEEQDGYALWTSDATQAYRIVDFDIRSVIRSVLVLFEIPAVIVVDRVTKYKTPSTIQARFFGDNWDEACRHHVQPNAFTVEKPNAVLHAQVFSPQAVTIQTGRLPIVEERAQRHPFVEVATAPTMAATLVTAMALGRTRDTIPPLTVQSTAEGILVSGAFFRCMIGDDFSFTVER